MKSVYSSPHLFWVVHYQNILMNHHINSFIKNEYLSGGAGELPPTECWPRLYVDKDDYERAKQLVENELSAEQLTGPPWICRHCGEENEIQFTVCWKCGAEQNQSNPDEKPSKI